MCVVYIQSNNPECLQLVCGHNHKQKKTEIFIQTICINGEKTFKTIWNKLEAEFPTIFNNCSVQLLENAATTQVGHHDLTAAEQRKRDAGITEETIAIDRLWKERPDG
jgi:hypothetical protein